MAPSEQLSKKLLLIAKKVLRQNSSLATSKKVAASVLVKCRS